jgi:hypothetical protein
VIVGVPVAVPLPMMPRSLCRTTLFWKTKPLCGE